MKKTCILYVHSMRQLAEEIGESIEAEGNSVCLTEVSSEQGEALRREEEVLDPGIDRCLAGADEKVLLIPAGVLSGQLQAAIGAARLSSGRLVGVLAAGAEIPKELDESADSVVGASHPQIAEAILKKDIWEPGTGNPQSARKPKRVKCQ